jgi:DNA-binding HxlR family transcriptional regulator
MGNHKMKSTEVLPNVYLQVCPSRELLVRVADKWAAMALVALSSRTLRFGELKRMMEGVSQKMLSQTLKNLERDGLLLRQVFTGRPLRVDYHLSDRGKALVKVLKPIIRWSQDHISVILEDRKEYDVKMGDSQTVSRSQKFVSGKLARRAQ